MALFTGIAAAVGAVGTFIGGLGVVGSFLLNTAVGVGLNLLAQAIAGKPKQASASFGVSGTLQAGGDVPRSFFVGQSAAAGSLVWANTWGQDGETPNAYLTQVIALADLPRHLLSEVFVNGEQVTFGPTPHPQYGYPVSQYQKGGADHLWMKWYDGTQTAADSFLVSTASNANRQWESTRVGYGVPYVIVTAKISQSMFSGIPSFKFVVSTAPFYDPSRDSTVPGGSGSQRWDNPATWGGDGDHNPVVQIYNLLRGLEYNGQWFYGLQGVPGARLPAADWVAQINKCRAGNIYRAGGEIPVDATLAQCIEALLTACQGRLSEVGGFYTIHAGEPDEPVASFTDGDILSTEGQSFTPFFGLSDTINGIAATYPSPADGWTEKAAPPLYRPDLEALAGNRRLMADVSLSFVPYPEQVQRLMKSALAEAQRARRHTLVLPPGYWPYAVPGVTLSWTSVRNGYVDKWFRVDGAVDRANLDVMIDITEVDPDDYDFDSETDFHPPVDGALGTLRPQPQPLVGWQAFPATIGPPGKQMPTIRVAYPGTLDDVRAVRVQVWRAAETAPLFDGEVPYGDPSTNDNPASVFLAGTFSPKTPYQVRGRLVPFGERETEWSELLPVTTPDVWVYDFEISLMTALAEIQGSASGLKAELNAKIIALSEALAETQQRAMEQGAFVHEQEITRQTDTESFAKKLIEVGAALDGKASAAAFFELLSQVGDIDDDLVSALARATIGVNVNNQVVGLIDIAGNMLESVVTILANKFLVAKPDGTGASQILTVGTTALGADRVGISGDVLINGTVTASALSVGQLSAVTADLGNITAGTIRNVENTIIFDLPNMKIYRTDGKMELDFKNLRFRMGSGS